MSSARSPRWARGARILAAAVVLVCPAARAAPWSDDNTARSDYERLSRQERRGGGPSEFDAMRLSMRMWIGKGRGITRSGYPFPFPICQGLTCYMPLKSVAALGNTVDFAEREHPMLVFNYELRVHRRLSFDVEAGGSGYGMGRADDHHWIHAPDSTIIYVPTDTVYRSPDNQDWSLSRALLKGDTRMLSSNAYFRVLILPGKYSPREDRIRQAFDVFAGYTLYQDTFHLREGNQVITNNTWSQTPPEGPFEGLDSRYRFHWEGFRFGIREEVVFPKGWALTGRFAYAPDLEFLGEGAWNRNKPMAPGFFDGMELKQGGTNSLQTARGRSFDGMVAASYSPWNFLSAELGYLYMYFKGGKGTDKILYSDGSSEDIELERVTSKRSGFFTGLTFKY
ncbi:MAG: hypothetical protein HY924_05750 [Elusimicrobia bacterium]|nr:hypothetical protein [Elusimicrobiota bacterium]